MRKKFEKAIWFSVFAIGSFNLACQPPANNSTTNANVSNANVNSNSSLNANAVNANGSNANMIGSTTSNIETEEPEQYQATVALKFETSGAQNLAVPPLKAEVARNGSDRRMEFALPNGEKLIYLERGGKQFVVSPNRKQYAEINKESVGFDPRRLLMPEQIVNQVRNLKGVERVGEEKIDGRDAVKYRYGATTNTQTKAGTVATESTILVDKETGLPLRSVTNSESQNGDVQGIKGLNFITEMSNIRTTADANLFAEPTDFQKVAPEQIKSQIDLVYNAAVTLFGQLLKSAQTTATPNQ